MLIMIIIPLKSFEGLHIMRCGKLKIKEQAVLQSTLDNWGGGGLN